MEDRKPSSSGSLRAIWVKRAHRGPRDSVRSAQLEAGTGILGNADARGRRQVTVIAEEAWEELQRATGSGAEPSVRRANLMVRGVSLEETRGKTLRVGRSRILIHGETKPCERMDEAWPGLRDAMRSAWRGGAYGEVLDSGTIRVGDSVEWTER